MRIAVENVSFAYDDATPALRGLDLTVIGGSSIALIGPNGSGKSTLLKVVSGVLRPDDGFVRLDDSSIDELSARQVARRLAMVEQERSMGVDFTVREVVAMGRIPHRGRFARESGDDRRAVDRAMGLADVQELADRSIRAVSGGERQRVFLAMAFAQGTDVLLLDEPTTHLDLHHQVQFMAIVRERAEAGMTVLIAIHDLTLAAQAVDRIALMTDGRILVTGTPREVLTPFNVRRAFHVEAVVGEHPELGTTYVLAALRSHRNPRLHPSELAGSA
jgi:iron complex transport system ATP-binding protein